MVDAKSTLFTRFDTEDKVAECRNRERAPTSGAECCSRTLVEQGPEATPETVELTSQVKKGSHSPDLRVVAVHTPLRPAPDSLRRLMRVVGARIDHAYAA